MARAETKLEAEDHAAELRNNGRHENFAKTSRHQIVKYFPNPGPAPQRPTPRALLSIVATTKSMLIRLSEITPRTSKRARRTTDPLRREDRVPLRPTTVVVLAVAEAVGFGVFMLDKCHHARSAKQNTKEKLCRVELADGTVKG